MIKLARNSKPSRIAAGFVLATTAAILAAGCSSGTTNPTTSTSASSTTVTTPAASSSTTVTTSAASSSTTTTTVASSSTTTTTSAGASGSGLLSKFQSGEQATFVATYKVTSGASKSLTSLTIAQQPPDSLFGGTSSSGNFELITLGKKGYICSGQSSGGTGGMCLSEGAAASEADLFKIYEPNFYLPYFQAAAKASGGQVSYSSKTVNGISLSCISVTGAAGEKGTGTFCVTDQGVLGYVAWTGATASDNGSFEITSYSTSVPANEFTLPATPTTIP
jgi:hypothetical protein